MALWSFMSSLVVAEYRPMYLSIGNTHDEVYWAHLNSLILLGFLPIPKSL